MHDVYHYNTIKNFKFMEYPISCQLTIESFSNRPISRVVIGREFDYRSRLIYVRYCLTNTTLCL